MKEIKILIIVIVLGGGFFVTMGKGNSDPQGESGIQTENSKNKSDKKEFRKILDNIQLINLDMGNVLTDSAKKLCRNTHKLIVWPSEDEIKNNIAKEDRTKQFPPFYALGKDITEQQAKELDLQPVSLTPTIALKESESWIKKIMKKELFPDDIQNWLLPILNNDPSKSKVICRFEIEGTKVQIVQLKWFIWIIIVPSNSLIKQNLTSEELVNMISRTFFTEGEKMSNLPKQEILCNSQDITSYRIGFYDFAKNKVKRDITYSWWWWEFICAESKSMTIFIKKGWEGMEHLPNIEEPWF